MQQESQKKNYQNRTSLEDYQQQLSSFFLFINSGSGGGLGNKLVSQESQIQKIQFSIPIREFQQKRKCHVYFYNMRQDRDVGFKRLKQQMKNGQKCCAIVCGGDGTVMWVVTQLIKYEIDVHSVPIGIIPLGTGNDFSRELGWGVQKTTLIENNYKSLKKLIRLWINAHQEYFDIWDFEAQIFQNGKFQKVENERSKIIEGHNLKRHFCNYFSFGIDGKIGYSFDMHRQKSRLGNLAMYGILGMAKTMTVTKTIDQLVESIQISSNQSSPFIKSEEITIFQKSGQSILQKSDHKMNQNIEGSKPLSQQSIIFKSQMSIQTKQESENNKIQKLFRKGYYNVLFLNINSYTGGVKDIWDRAKPGFLKDHLIQQKQVSTGDGKIQIVSFSSSFAIAMQRNFGGFAKKVTQGEGPFIFNFRKYENAEKHRTYLQIDGQFIRFTHPKLIRIQRSKLVPKGKIRVLRRNLKYEPDIPEQKK